MNELFEEFFTSVVVNDILFCDITKFRRLEQSLSDRFPEFVWNFSYKDNITHVSMTSKHSNLSAHVSIAPTGIDLLDAERSNDLSPS